jgi:restriction system protein
VERQDVQVLHDKIRSTGAQKGMLFSIAGFQSGALDYAGVHGIALVQLADGASTWFTKSFGHATPIRSHAGVPQYVGWWCHGKNMSVMSSEIGEYTREALGLSS